jgi:hypothetical protein
MGSAVLGDVLEHDGVLSVSVGRTLLSMFDGEELDWSPASGRVEHRRAVSRREVPEDEAGTIGPYGYEAIGAPGSDGRRTEVRRTDGSVVARAPWPDGLAPTLAYDPRHDRIAFITGSGAAVQVVDARDGSVLFESPARTEATARADLRFSPDGSLLAAPSRDRGQDRTRLWDVDHGRLRSIVDAHATTFSPDARLVASSTPRLFDTATGQPLGAPIPGLVVPTVISFSNAGRELLVDDGHLVGITLDERELRARACALAGGPLTEEAWRTLVPELEPQRTCTEH